MKELKDACCDLGNRRITEREFVKRLDSIVARYFWFGFIAGICVGAALVAFFIR